MARVAVESEIAGSIWKIEVEAGKSVSEGDTLLIIESMKMEIPVVAPGDGTVAEILVKEKDAVSEGQPLLMLET
ncbi:MAG: biotin/lipoyl-binding carrier protein [SAR324 cluster bacterium]|nr:biotin/lipoyl-binding carrier protein [SAR324 cluster bacterium]